jgi:peroxiredoxin
MSLRPIINVSLVALFCSAIIYSMAMQSGHADVPIAESADLIEPLGAGDNAPRFIVETANGDAFDFDPSKLDRPAVLLTFRGGWCPFCNMYLSEMRHVIPEMRKMGVDVLFLSGDRPEMLFESLSQETQEDIDGLDYTILSDANAQAAIALGIAFRASERTLNWLSDKDIADSSMMKHGVLPVPAVFAIDTDGVIQFAFTNADYKVRLPADELMAAAREIAAAE